MYANPCEYKGYEDFNADVLRLFVQEKKLKNYRGSEHDAAKKRLQRAKRTENYWSSLTAPYTEYGFYAVISHKNEDNSDESVSEEQSPTKQRQRQKKTAESKKQKQHQIIRSNIKKRVKRAESLSGISSANKRRRLNNDV